MVKNQAKEAMNSLIENQESFLLSLDNISSLEGTLCCVDGKIIGTGRPDYTQSSTEYNLVVDDNEFLLIDIPGIEGDEGKYKEIIKESLLKAHMIFYVNGSGKKAEKETLEKIKNYMHDGTAVYAIFNVHCKAQKERIKGIDKTYQEELTEAYRKQKNEIVPQTEEKLKSFLGSNFKGSVCVNGLLSFCAMAIDGYGTSTIAKDEDKNLKSTQAKFLKEYSNDLDAMRCDSAILDVQSIILERIAHFDEHILEENLKKLKMRLSDMLSDVTSLRDKEKNKIKNFLREYDTFEYNCRVAKDDFLQTIGGIGRREVSSAFAAVQDELFAEIENCGGKIKEPTIKSIFDRHKDQIAADIQKAINKKIKAAMEEYQDSIREAEKRLLKDLQRDQKKFEIKMSEDKLRFDSSFKSGFDFDLKGLTKDMLTIAGYAASGFLIGSIAGAIIGGIVGCFIKFWEGVATKAKKINRAKEKLKREIDDQIDSIVSNVKKEIKKLGMDAKIEAAHDEIQKSITVQKRALRDIERMLDVVVMELNNRYKQI